MSERPGTEDGRQGATAQVQHPIRERMNRTGIGLAGIDGAWWLPATGPFALPHQLARDLDQIAHTVFRLFDVVTEQYGTPMGDEGGVDQLLTYKVPPSIPRLMGQGRVLGVRPDLQLRPLAGPRDYQLVATELEICPSAQGFAHAMQVGYGLIPDLVQAYARLLDGRELLIVGSVQWSEFLFEQLAFCRALDEVGARGRVLYDLPISALAEQVRRGTVWRPPLFGIRERPAVWHDDIIGRIRAHGFERFVWPDGADWPDGVGDALVFRFGYFDCFAPERLSRLLNWEVQGATLLNPTSFLFDSKVVMAALQLPAVRRRIAATDLLTLDQCIPETIIVDPTTVARLRDERASWVVKYAGYDHGNQAWGGRSVQVGALHSPTEWEGILEHILVLPWPVVAQRTVPTARIEIAYLDANDQPRVMRNGATRLRSFMLRHPRAKMQDDDITVCGAHLTVVSDASQVAESTDAVQAPVIWS